MTMKFRKTIITLLLNSRLVWQLSNKKLWSLITNQICKLTKEMLTAENQMTNYLISIKTGANLGMKNRYFLRKALKKIISRSYSNPSLSWESQATSLRKTIMSCQKSHLKNKIALLTRMEAWISTEVNRIKWIKSMKTWTTRVLKTSKPQKLEMKNIHHNCTKTENWSRAAKNNTSKQVKCSRAWVK